jgi:hypothetical protein
MGAREAARQGGGGRRAIRILALWKKSKIPPGTGGLLLFFNRKLPKIIFIL